MSVIGSSILAGASGSAGGDPVYVDDVFSTTLYEGKSTLSGNVVVDVQTGIDNVNETTLVWIKNRDASFSHKLGILSGNQFLESDNTSGQSSNLQISALTDGVRLPSYSAYGNRNGENFVCWNFKAEPGFFDVVTYTGNGTAGRTIAHNLGSVPGMIIVKRTDASNSWSVFHRSLGGTHYLELETSGSAGPNASKWNNTNPTSTHFTLGNSVTVNNNGGTYVAYIFAHDDAVFGTDGDESIIKCGSFNTPSSGKTSVNIGFEPQFVLLKETSGTGNWFLLDTMRGMPNTVGGPTYSMANLANAEVTGGALFAATSTGFDHEGQFGNNNTFIYMAIRRPHKPPEAATEVFAMDTGSTSSTTPTFDSGFVVDAALEDNYLHARLCGPQSMFTYLARANNADTLSTWDSNLGWAKSYNSSTLSYMFRRAPGFMDVVVYDGDNANVLNIPHNLTVKPEAMIIKNRELAVSWAWYDAVNGATNYMQINDTGSSAASSGFWNDTEPTSSVFTVGTNSLSVNGRVGDGETHVAFLFATLPGISKVGSYSGTGSAINVDCGFTNGARFILIKRSNGTGDWYYWDTFNGIVSGNDSYNRLNLSPSRVTGTDYIDPLSTGFTVTSSAPAALNATGGTYLFLAIA